MCAVLACNFDSAPDYNLISGLYHDESIYVSFSMSDCDIVHRAHAFGVVMVQMKLASTNFQQLEAD